MEYNEIVINRIGESKIERLLLNNVPLQYNTLDEDEMFITYGIENYIIKYFNNPKTPELKQAIDKYINKIMNNFKKNPLIINSSCILSNFNNVKQICKNYPDMYKEGIDKLKYNIGDIYNRLMEDKPISEDERNRIMTCFSQMNNDSIEYNEKLKRYLKKVLEKNIIPNNILEKQFIFNYATRYVLNQAGYQNKKCNLRIVNLESNNPTCHRGGYQINGFIVMNNKKCERYTDFYNKLYQMVQCAMHEATHYVQEIKSKTDEKSIQAMEMTIQRLFGSKNYHDGDNYLFNEIEEDAQRKGYWYASLLYEGINPKITNALIEEKLNYIKETKFQYEYVTLNKPNSKIEVISKEKYNVENIRKVVKNNPSLIKEYPVLKNLFDDKGNYKGIDKILSEKFKSHDISEMYTDFIIYDIRHNGLDNIKMINKTDQEKKNIINKLNNILYKKVDNVIKALDDYDYRMDSQRNKNKTKFLVDKHLKDIITISSFLDKKLSFIRRKEKETNTTAYGYAYYQQNIRSLMYNIERTKYNNKLGNLEEPLKNNIKPLVEFSNNLKKEYLKGILESFTDEERKTKLTIKNETMTLEDFVLNEVYNHMDYDHYLYKDNGKIICNKEKIPVQPNDFIRRILKKQIEKNESSTKKR